MRTFYKIKADKPTVLDIFNLMWNKKHKVNDVVVYDSKEILTFNDLYVLSQEIAIFNENFKLGKVYLEEL